MKKILIASENTTIKTAMDAVQKNYGNYFNFEFCSTTEEVLHTISYSLPEIKIIDFSAPKIDWEKILCAIGEDPWLHNGGIIAIAQDNAQVMMIENLKNVNILIVQTVDNFVRNFASLLRVLQNNPQLLYSRFIKDELGEKNAWSFVTHNNAFDIQVYSNFLLNYLYSSNYIAEDTRFKLQTVLMELLFNALEHGNCGITYEEKSAWLEQGRDILDLIAEKNKDPVVSQKRIHVTYHIGKSRSKFTIRDDGEGFDWKSRLEGQVKAGLHGMGIKISESFVENLYYNDKGNEVSFYVPIIHNEVNNIPAIFAPYKAEEYNDKDIVCKQNEPGNDLYFIVSGRYAVYVNRKLISVLTPKDMFIGEMAFLLNDRRSAAIIAVGKGKLIKIPKPAFIDLIRKNPHYGLFLSKLLAQRLYAETHKRANSIEENKENVL